MHWKVRQMRRPAVNMPGDAHELTFSCYRGYQFLNADRTCQWLADSLNEARTALDFALWAYVFMPEHVHLMIWPRRPVYGVSIILAAIKESVSRQAIKHMCQHAPHWLPRITVQHGKRSRRHFWQIGGGFDRSTAELRAILAMIEYIHANPVRRGLVTRPEEWKWSSAGWVEGKNSLSPDPIDFGGSCVFFGGRE